MALPGIDVRAIRECIMDLFAKPMTVYNSSISLLPKAVANALLFVFLASLVTVPDEARAQQFYGDNQWVAPHGVATLVGIAGTEYSQAIATAALIPEWEFNLSFVHTYDDPLTESSSYNSGSFYVKHRLSQNDRETAGYAIMAGTGLWPEHIVQGKVSGAGESWWANLNATYSFLDDSVLLDVLPGFVVDLDRERGGETAWGFTYGSRVAIYDLIPQSAIVAEVFGTTGEASTEPSYRAGLRWESPKLIVALTYTDAFDGSAGEGVELGFMYFTEPRFCFGGCRK